jgi:hypothetical protein
MNLEPLALEEELESAPDAVVVFDEKQQGSSGGERGKRVGHAGHCAFRDARGTGRSSISSGALKRRTPAARIFSIAPLPLRRLPKPATEVRAPDFGDDWESYVSQLVPGDGSFGP